MKERIAGYLMQVSDYKSVNEYAEEWGLTPHRIRTMCSEGKIAGAIKFGRDWPIPQDVEKPKDGRVVSGKYKDFRKRNHKDDRNNVEK